MSRTPKITRAARRIRDTYSLPLTTAKVIAQALHQRGWLDGDHEDAVQYLVRTELMHERTLTVAQAVALLEVGSTSIGTPVSQELMIGHGGSGKPVVWDPLTAAGSFTGQTGVGKANVALTMALATLDRHPQAQAYYLVDPSLPAPAESVEPLPPRFHLYDTTADPAAAANFTRDVTAELTRRREIVEAGAASEPLSPLHIMAPGWAVLGLGAALPAMGEDANTHVSMTVDEPGPDTWTMPNFKEAFEEIPAPPHWLADQAPPHAMVVPSPKSLGRSSAAAAKAMLDHDPDATVIYLGRVDEDDAELLVGADTFDVRDGELVYSLFFDRLDEIISAGFDVSEAGKTPWLALAIIGPEANLPKYLAEYPERADRTRAVIARAANAWSAGVRLWVEVPTYGTSGDPARTDPGAGVPLRVSLGDPDPGSVSELFPAMAVEGKYRDPLQPEIDHHVEIADDGTLTFSCAAPVGASCREVCANGCEEYHAKDCDRTMTDGGECNALLWLNGSGTELEAYTGELTDPRKWVSGPIETWWDNDEERFLWRFAGEEGDEPSLDAARDAVDRAHDLITRSAAVGAHLMPLVQLGQRPSDPFWTAAPAMPVDDALQHLDAGGNLGVNLARSRFVVLVTQDRLATDAVVDAGFTLTVSTPESTRDDNPRSGGNHTWLRVPEDIDAYTLPTDRIGIVLPNGGGIDVLAGNRYVVAPPSRLDEADEVGYAPCTGGALDLSIPLQQLPVAPRWLFDPSLPAPSSLESLAGILAPDRHSSGGPSRDGAKIAP